jgi:hypothetical protein
MESITILVRCHGTQPCFKSFTGRWVASHLDWATQARYSLAETWDGGFVCIRKVDSDEAVELEIWEAGMGWGIHAT